MPSPLTRRPQGARQGGKIAQRIVPHTLRPDALRGDLVELGDVFRAYQQRTEPGQHWQDRPAVVPRHARPPRTIGTDMDLGTQPDSLHVESALRLD
ncbi:hypothetical protein E4K73_38570 [Streptomyces sp. IB201691-2A2]|nr:hypothetical protein E4K73_38570 [Streptomyces sp. IB201691-2A2]